VTRTLVVTCPVPCEDLAKLKLTPQDHTIAVSGPNGFRHDLELPLEADMSNLHVEVFKGILEVRAPRHAT
jgi:ferredoxin-NADP reductase